MQIAMLGGQVKGPVPDTAGAAGTKQGSGAVSMQVWSQLNVFRTVLYNYNCLCTRLSSAPCLLLF